MSRRLLVSAVLVNVLLVAGIVWLLWPEPATDPAPAPVTTQDTPAQVYVRPRPPRGTDTQAAANEVRVGPITATVPAGFEARGRIYGKTTQVLFFPKDPATRRTAAILLTPPTGSLGKRVRVLTTLTPGLARPPRITRVGTTGIAGQAAGFAITDRRVKASRAVVLINRGRHALSVEAMGPQSEAGRTTRTALTIARSIKVR